MIQLLRKDGFQCVSVKSDMFEAIFLPEIGGKMVELNNLQTGRQFLLQPQEPPFVYCRPGLTDEFVASYAYGFDECFPTIAPSMGFPDHGEVWQRPWETSVQDDLLILSIQGLKGEYTFEKRVRVERNVLGLTYRVQNRSARPMNFIWSAHPLLQAPPGARILLPRSVQSVFLHWASDDVLGRHGDLLSWPSLGIPDAAVDYSLVRERGLGQAVKCFTNRLSEGYAGLFNEETGECLLFEFNPNVTPYLGVWLCYGGWPVDAKDKHLTVALEPCNGRPDAVEEAMQRGECGTIGAGETQEWDLRLSVSQDVPPGLHA